jgi:hypothetical protein
MKRITKPFLIFISICIQFHCANVNLTDILDTNKEDNNKKKAQLVLANGSIIAADPGPANFTSGGFLSEVNALCKPEPCLHPLNETNPIYKMNPDDQKIYSTALIEFEKLNKAPQPLPDNPSFAEKAAAIERPQSLKDTLHSHSKFFNGGYDDLTPYAFSRLMIKDLGDSRNALTIARRYELKEKRNSSIALIAQIEKMIEINKVEKVLDNTWLEAELIAAIQMRRTILMELRNREIWKYRSDPQKLKELSTGEAK